MNSVSEIEKATWDSTTERILFLDNLRAVAIIMVVGIHAISYCVPLPDSQKEVISFLMDTAAVPVFFLVDGFLFARSAALSQDFAYFKIVQRSLFRLLVPWAIFTALYTFARYSFEVTGFLNEKLIVGHSWHEVAIAAYGSVYAAQMYFLASLFLIRLCGPIFRKFALANNHFSILMLFFCYCAAYATGIGLISPYLSIDGGQEPILHALWGTQFYMCGILLARTSSIVNLNKFFVPALLLLLVTLPVHGELGDVGHVVVQYSYLIALFLLFLGLGNRIPLLDTIGKNTMGIYLIHAPVVMKGVSLVLNKLIVVPAWSFVSVLFGTLVVTICIVTAVNYIPYGVLMFGTPYRQGKSASVSNRLTQ